MLPMEPKQKKKKGKKKMEKKRLQEGLLCYVSLRFETKHLIQHHILFFLQGNEYATHQCFFWVFLGIIMCYSQRGHDPKENLVLFGYKLNMRVKFKNILLCFWLPT
jgi:hypothetical protein